MDQRNFHCWNYRRSIVKFAQLNPGTEFIFAETKILENFSNYSAFHHRSIYILKLTDIDGTELELLEKEFSMVDNAIFTEPDDQV